MASVFKPAGSKKYVILYTDETGRRRKKTGATDKTVTQRIGRDIENRVALRREGLIDPADESYAAHEARPLTDHLADFRRSLEAKGGTAKHASVTSNRAQRILKLARARRIADISSSKALDAMAALRDEGLSTETINHHIRAVKGFSRWLWKDGRAREHHLAHLSIRNSEADRRRCRRALTQDEAARLVMAANRGPVVLGITGPDRARLYSLALGTGFRASELGSLTAGRFNLSADPPTATVPAAYTKNGKEAVQPIPLSLAEELAPWLASMPSDRLLFNLPDRTADMVRVDLAAAGIEYETPSGVVDFHALRGCYVSYLVASGASVKTCQVLARHSTPSLTIGIYAKASLHDIVGAVESLPDLNGGRDRPEAVAATGTDAFPAPSATQNATHHAVDEAQSHVRYRVLSMSSEDLKSSGGHPPCGFESHRRQSRQNPSHSYRSRLNQNHLGTYIPEREIRD